MDSLQSHEILSSLQTTFTVCRLQTTVYKDCAVYSLKTAPKADQTAQEEHKVATKAKVNTAHEPRSAQVSWCKSSITMNGKTHPLPTTKEYILYEYVDVFKGVGTLPGGPYHIKLKDSYKQSSTHQGQCHWECSLLTRQSWTN